MKTQQKLKKETPHIEIAIQFTHINTSQNKTSLHCGYYIKQKKKPSLQTNKNPFINHIFPLFFISKFFLGGGGKITQIFIGEKKELRLVLTPSNSAFLASSTSLIRLALNA